jgi:hypothetical protein
MRTPLLGTTLVVLVVAVQAAQAAPKLTPAEAARQVDQSLAQEISSKSATTPRTGTQAGIVDDEGFIRRATLDLVGRPPTAEEVTAFVLDPTSDKRAQFVRRLLADPTFGKNWGRYWRDVVMYRASEPRALLASETLENYFTEQLNKGTSWKEIAKAFVTATGDVRENGATAIIFAQQGQAEETTAEIARIFMGIQIQCAQCHDHPTDRWKRQQFHELAAFFPRIAVRPKRDAAQRSFEVVSLNRQPPKLAKQQPGRGQLEHYMPDLNNPSARGTLMTPKFFVNNRSLETGKSDEERRTLLANWLTGSSNPWFARAIINRMWSELVGEGFYEPVDDIGPDRICSAPKTLDMLSEQFAVNQYSLKWLFETITSTSAYQRVSRQRRNETEMPFAANCAQRLRGDQLLTAITQVLGVSEQAMGGGPRPKQGAGPFGGGGPRFAFNQTFGFDPSAPRDEIAGSIPQALFLMNSPLINGAINARNGSSVLGQLLAQNQDDKTVVSELYLRCLSREPRPAETQKCLDHVKKVGDRREAFEDVLWALMNSTEFLHRK